MYLDDIAARIRSYIPADRMPDENAKELLHLYALLLKAKGTAVTESDIHDAWSVWMAQREATHESLVPYEKLPPTVRDQDAVFAHAVRLASQSFEQSEAMLPLFEKVLFPSGPPRDKEAVEQTVELYKIMVSSSESLVRRRQAVNTFFLTINGALLTAFGLIVRSSGADRLGALGISVLAVAGAIGSVKNVSHFGSS